MDMMTLIYRTLAVLALCCGLSVQLNAQSSRYGREQRYQEQLRGEYGTMLEYAAAQVGSYVMQLVAPNTGKDLSTEALVYDGIQESKADGYVSCSVRIVFQARQDMLSPMGEAEMVGQMVLYPAYRRTDKHKAELTISQYNQHFGLVAGNSRLKKLERGVMVEYR